MPITSLDPNLIRAAAADGTASSIPDAIDSLIAKVNELVADGGAAAFPSIDDDPGNGAVTITQTEVAVVGFLDVSDGANVTDYFTVKGAGAQNLIETDGPNLEIGFYGAAPVALQTGVAVSAAAIHAALVNLGLIAP